MIPLQEAVDRIKSAGFNSMVTTELTGKNYYSIYDENWNLIEGFSSIELAVKWAENHKRG